MIWFVLVSPTKPSTPSAPLPSQRPSTPTSSSRRRLPLKSCPTLMYATGGPGRSTMSVPATGTIGTCAGSTSVSMTKALRASSGCGYVTGCRLVRGTAAIVTASPSAIRGGGGEPATVRAQVVGLRITNGPTGST
ncbi:hypothetical protein V493_07460 [Pseudogymnoascus sp. VKM F-4281 (FW-2241)]|nr:hypothetical protein V493_07460 [Pseudogymnoascus sp. VKM F-4281 (FW-2241)]